MALQEGIKIKGFKCELILTIFMFFEIRFVGKVLVGGGWKYFSIVGEGFVVGYEGKFCIYFKKFRIRNFFSVWRFFCYNSEIM